MIGVSDRTEVVQTVSRTFSDNLFPVGPALPVVARGESGRRVEDGREIGGGREPRPAGDFGDGFLRAFEAAADFVEAHTHRLLLDGGAEVVREGAVEARAGDGECAGDFV